MEINKSTKAILTRNRDKRHNKRWSDTETKQLLEYLLQQDEFEKPTAQIFYRKFLNISKLDATWDLCRWKTKSLKSTYKKAEIWRRSNGSIANDANVQDKLRKMCRFYDDLHCLFGNKLQIFANDTLAVNTSSNTNNKQSNSLDSAMEENIEKYFIIAIKSEANEDHHLSLIVPERLATTSPDSSIPVETSADERDLNNQQESMDQEFFRNDLQSMKNEKVLNEKVLNSFFKMKFDFEKEKFHKEFELKERRLAEQIKERRESFELKKLQMQKEERLRRLELEKQEIVERFEIEMRYRCKEK